MFVVCCVLRVFIVVRVVAVVGWSLFANCWLLLCVVDCCLMLCVVCWLVCTVCWLLLIERYMLSFVVCSVALNV